MALKFKPLEKKIDIEWKDGAILKFERPKQVDREKLIDNLPEEIKKNPTSLGFVLMKQFLTGWENIEDGDSGNVLEFNEKNKDDIFEAIQNDPDLIQKLTIFVRGTLGN